MTIEVFSYRPEDKLVWDQFIKQSKNGTFLFMRDYMDYHADRFVDASLLFYRNSKLLAVFPASRHHDEIISHGGLTYGGVISGSKVTAQNMILIFQGLCRHYDDARIDEVVYKAMPTIYHKLPAQEDLYALFRIGVAPYRIDVSTSIDLKNVIAFSKGRKHSIAKARKEGVSVEASKDFPAFWNMLQIVLSERHDATPTHTLNEIQQLESRFPENILLYGSFLDKKMVAGAVIYDCGDVVHTQYLSVTAEGREIGALDLLLEYLIKERYTDRRYFDFGISTENQGGYLNKGLISQKEMFGGRSVVHPFYRIKVADVIQQNLEVE